MKTFTKIIMSAILIVSNTTLWAAEVAPGTTTPIQEKIVNSYKLAIKTKNFIKNMGADKDEKAKEKRDKLINIYKNQTAILEGKCEEFCTKPIAPQKKEFCDAYCKLDTKGQPVEPKPEAREEEHKESAA